MSWTNAQKSLFAQACAAIGYGQDQRRMVLSGFPHAICGKDHPTSTSKKLNNSDFEHAMAIVEGLTPGQRIVLRLKRFPTMHFAGKAADDLARMRGKVKGIETALVKKQALHPNGEGLRGWISSRITEGRTDRLDQLTYDELYNLIEGLKAYARRNRVRID